MNETLCELNERYSRFAELKPEYDRIIGIIRERFEEAVRTDDITVLDGYQQMYSAVDNLRTAETYRLDTIAEIMNLEKEYEGKSPFCLACTDLKTLIEHYTRCILYLRRLELPLDESLKIEALEYLKKMHFSPYAALMILNNEIFAHKSFIASVLFENLHNDETFEKKMTALKQYSILMDSDTFLLEKALLFIRQGYIGEALTDLRNIEKPSESVLELIEKLEVPV